MATLNIELAYVKGKQSTKSVPMKAQDIVVIEFTTPADLGDRYNEGYVQTTENPPGAVAQREMCISTTPGDFTPNTLGNHGNPTNWSAGPQPQIYFAKPVKPGQKPAAGFVIDPSTTYYANVRNVDPPQENCAILAMLQAR